MRASRRGRPRRSGATAVETAAVLPLFLLTVLGLVEMAQLGMTVQVLSSAAREGCRVAVIGERTRADVQDAVEARLRTSGIPAGTVDPTPSNWATAPKGTPITVALAVPYRQISWLAEPLHLGDATVRASATLSSERP